MASQRAYIFYMNQYVVQSPCGTASPLMSSARAARRNQALVMIMPGFFSRKVIIVDTYRQLMTFRDQQGPKRPDSFQCQRRISPA